jgi:hypothetical protein
MASSFGPDSPVFLQTYPQLQSLFQYVKDVPEVSLQFRLWRTYRPDVNNAPEDDEANFVRETYLALLARLVARLFLDNSPLPSDVDELTKILDGEFFQEQYITNFIEEDFFTWLLCPPVHDQGLALMVAMADSLSNYDLRSCEPDVLVDLYKRFVPAPSEVNPGIIPVPEWLAGYVLSEDTESPAGPDHSVLDPCCGTGAFLASAVRTIKHGLLERGEDTFDTLLLILDHVQGMDSQPLAVTIARTSYLLALGDLVQDFHPPVLLPVYLSDASTPRMREPSPELVNAEPVYEFGGSEPAEVFHIPKSVALNPVMLDWLFDRFPNYLKGAHLRTRGEDPEDAIQAVLVALYNYLVAPKLRTPIPEPLSPFATGVMIDTAETLIRLYLHQPTTIWLHILKNAPAPVHLAQRKFDLVVSRFSRNA